MSSERWNHERTRMSRRSFLGSGTIAAASILAGDRLKTMMAQDARGAAINECKVVNDPNREERLALKAIREAQQSQ